MNTAFYDASSIDLNNLPTGWTIARLDDIIVEVKSGKSSGQHSPSPPGIVHLRPMNISSDGAISLAKLKYVQETRVDEFPRLRAGDILFNNTNSAKLVGKTTTIETTEDWSYSNHMTVLRVPSTFCARFLGLQIHYLWMSGFFQHLLKRHLNQASISHRTLVQSTTLTVPPAKEQFRIVETVDALFVRLKESVALLQRARTNATVLQKLIIRSGVIGTSWDSAPQGIDRQEQDIEAASALLRDLETRRTPALPVSTNAAAPAVYQRFPEMPFGEVLPERLPPGWVWTTVQDLGEVRLGRQRSPRHQTGTHLRPYLRVANVLENRIDISDVKTMNFTPTEFSTFCLRHGDILLNEGQSVELVGRPAMFRGEISGCCFQNTLIRFRPNDRVISDFALLVFRFFLHYRVFQKIARWSTNIAHLGLSRFRSMSVPLPPIDEQHRIVFETTRKLSMVDEHGRTISSLVERADIMRKAILSEAFSGRLIPQRATDDPAHDLVAAAQRARVERRVAGTGYRRVRTGDTNMNRIRRLSLVDALRDGGGRLAIRDLFERCGFTDQTIDDFYFQVKLDIEGGRIREVRQDPEPDAGVVHDSYMEIAF